jgi:hypothetical protein
MQGILLISLVCALLGIVSVRAAICPNTSLRRIMITRIVAVIFGLSAVAAPLVSVQPALAAAPMALDTTAPVLICSIYQPDQVIRDDIDKAMQAGIGDFKLGTWDGMYNGIIQYDNAYNMAPRHDLRHQKAAESMTCGFLYKAILEAQLIEARRSSTPPETSAKILAAPENLRALSDLEIELFESADLRIAEQLAPHPERNAWEQRLLCVTANDTAGGARLQVPYFSG